MDLDDTFGIVLAGEYDSATGRGWHPGVIGIRRGRKTEEFEPWLSPSGSMAMRGRAVADQFRVDLHAGIGRCKHLLKRFGGHYSAAGITIAREQVAAFTAAFNESDVGAQWALVHLVPGTARRYRSPPPPT